MAFGDSGIVGADLAQIFNVTVGMEATIVGRTSCPVVGVLLGDYQMDDPTADDPYVAGVKNLTEMVINGGKTIEIPFAARQAAPTPIGYGTNERAALTPRSTNDAQYANGTAVITNYAEAYDWEKSRFDMYRGKELKFKEYWLTECKRIMSSWFEHFDAKYSAAKTAAQAANLPGSMLWALMADSYLGIDRTSSDNADLRHAFYGADVATDVTITTAWLHEKQTTLRKNLVNGKIVVLCGTTAYNKFHAVIEAAGGVQATQMRDDTLIYGGEYFCYGNNMIFVHAHRLDAKTAIFASPETWVVGFDKTPLKMDPEGPQRAKDRQAVMRTFVDCRTYLACLDPFRNGVMTEITTTS